LDNFRVQKIDSNGKFIAKWGSEGSREGQFSNVTLGIDVDPSDHVYVIDKEGANIQKFDSNGNFVAKWVGEGDGDASEK